LLFSYLFPAIEKATILTDGFEESEGNIERVSEVPLGRIPIMVRSYVCWLSNVQTGKEFASLGECEFDEGGYFVVHGTEKVLIAQEKMAHNHVYVFKKAAGERFPYVAVPLFLTFRKIIARH
jgi:DNA-directed RNA polymerase II subunit RPB2